MRTLLLALGLLASASVGCVTSGGGGGDGDADADADVDTNGGTLRDYCEAFVPCTHPGAEQSEIETCVDNATPSQECINCVLGACGGGAECLDCSAATDGCQGSGAC